MLRWNVSCAAGTGPRAETFLHGSRQALRKRTGRMPQLEQEDASRFPTGPGPTATLAGLIEHRSEPGGVVLVHTEVDPAFEGQGLGERLVAGALADLRARGLKLVPQCPFVRAYPRRHPDQTDLVAGDPAVPE
jgi:uncharacterized protein